MFQNKPNVSIIIVEDSVQKPVCYYLLTRCHDVCQSLCRKESTYSNRSKGSIDSISCRSKPLALKTQGSSLKPSNDATEGADTLANDDKNKTNLPGASNTAEVSPSRQWQLGDGRRGSIDIGSGGEGERKGALGSRGGRGESRHRSVDEGAECDIESPQSTLEQNTAALSSSLHSGIFNSESAFCQSFFSLSFSFFSLSLSLLQTQLLG